MGIKGHLWLKFMSLHIISLTTVNISAHTFLSFPFFFCFDGSSEQAECLISLNDQMFLMFTHDTQSG